MQYYVYHLIDSRTSLPIYVGKGSGNRMYEHEKFIINNWKTYTNPQLKNKIRKILKENGFIHYVKVFETDSEQEAYDFETREIARIGRSNLCNLTDGGDGFKGGTFHHTEEHKRKISQLFKGKPKSEEHKQKLKQSKLNKPTMYWKGKQFSREHKQKLSQARRSWKMSPEHIQRVTTKVVERAKRNKGKTLEEIYGPERGSQIRARNKLATLGKKYSIEVNAKKGRRGQNSFNAKTYRVTNNSVTTTMFTTLPEVAAFLKISYSLAYNILRNQKHPIIKIEVIS